ncbi:MAG: DNA polymerase III subunit gamma/tau, partial [Clostridia bacterium]|nr:DNA polymerase III subunit gamma/tau [Clostridia bacterium]
MSYLALYREFRPQTFKEVVDQKHIVETLKNQVMTKKIGHAYLFCGTRGTGKTSCAKIFAKAVNCLSPKNGSPCGECEVCKSIQTNGNLDIVEIDAASNNGVDQIRDLREKVNFLPTVAKYKVYIIDEVHMLTENAFNALLKTLEEPPEHVIFILATTEPEKIPATILSRCMRFDFKLVDTKNLVNHLKNIFDKIGIKYEDAAVELIAKAGKGSVRDTLSIAEMCKSFASEKLMLDDVEKCLGFTDSETLKNIATAVAKKDGKTIILEIEKIYNSGKNMSVLMTELIDLFKKLITIKIASDYDLNETKEDLAEYTKIASLFDEKFLIEALKTLSLSSSEIKLCDDQKAYILSTLIGLYYTQNAQLDDLQNRVIKIENNIKNGQILQKNAENLNKIDGKAPIFEEVDKKKDNLNDDANRKNENEIFGELIKFTREQNEHILHQCFGDIKNVRIDSGK